MTSQCSETLKNTFNCIVIHTQIDTHEMIERSNDKQNGEVQQLGNFEKTNSDRFVNIMLVIYRIIV